MQRVRRRPALKRARAPDAADALHGRRAYRKALRGLQRRIASLTERVAARQGVLVVVLEGWDASGKSGTTRRLVRGLRPELHRSIAIVAPTRAEARHPFPARFRRHLRDPAPMTVFDRSWYGRVLFERVEGLASPADVEHAYRAIRRLEASLVGPRRALLKVWLEISAAEQRRRLLARAGDPAKRHKLNADDWRNLAQREAYEVAREDMFARTSTRACPWVVVDANDKRRARIRVLERVARALERLQRARSPRRRTARSQA